jgi:hypothetical protein
MCTVLFVCERELYYCHRLTTQLQLTNMSYQYHISYADEVIMQYKRTNCAFSKLIYHFFLFLIQVYNPRVHLQDTVAYRLQSSGVRNGFLNPWNWDRQFIPKRRLEITTTRCVKTQKSAVLSRFAVEAWNHQFSRKCYDSETKEAVMGWACG